MANQDTGRLGPNTTQRASKPSKTPTSKVLANNSQSRPDLQDSNGPTGPRKQGVPFTGPWAASTRHVRVYTKPWFKNQHEAEGRRFVKYADRVCEALKHEDPNYEWHEVNQVPSADADLTICAYFHTSVIEASQVYWDEISDSNAFFQRFLELIGYQEPGFVFADPSATGEGLLLQPRDNADLKRLLQNAGRTIMDQYMSLVQTAVEYISMRQQMRLLFHLAQRRGSGHSQRLCQNILYTRPDLHIRHYKGRFRFDPCFLEDFAHGLAQIVHDLGRLINIAGFERLKDGDRSRFGRLRGFVNNYYQALESSYPTKMDFKHPFDKLDPPRVSIRGANTLKATALRIVDSTDIAVSDCKNRTTPSIQWVDFSFTSYHIRAHRPEYVHLLDPVTGQFSYGAACEVYYPVLTKLYHSFEKDVFDYMCLYDTEMECPLVKAKRIRRQKWAVPDEILRALTISIRYRQAASEQCKTGGTNLGDGHGIWTQKMIEVRMQLLEAAKEAAEPTRSIAVRSEPLHGQLRDSLSKCWRVDKWSKKPFIADVRRIQADTSR